MKTQLHPISEGDLARVQGGQFSMKNNGWKGGSLTTPGGNAIHVAPTHTTVALTPGLTNRVANGLNVIAAASAIKCPPIAAAAGTMGSMMSFMNMGKGVKVVIPHGMPAAFILPKK